MVVGTLGRTSGAVTAPWVEGTVDCCGDSSSDTGDVWEQVGGGESEPEVYSMEGDIYSATAAHFRRILSPYGSGTGAGHWSTRMAEEDEEGLGVWGSAKLRKLLSEPVGSPVELSFEEAAEIVRLAAGRRPDLPQGKDAVRETRELLGHSLLDRLKKAS